jgi:DNA repair protein RadA/Sms
VLEHLVDCVLQFEGERERAYRTIRALKNRFGSTNEVGVFEMRERGLVEVQDASSRFVAEATRAPGSVVLCAMEGSRPLLVEVQALVAPTELVPPRRVANGVDRNRLALVLAVLARHGGVAVGSSDVFVSVAGGVRVDEPGADLAIALAVASAARGTPVGAAGSGGAEAAMRTGGAGAPSPDDRPLAAFGEIGLTGELRYVAHPERRIAEAAKFGLEPVLSPEGPARTLRQALGVALGARAATFAGLAGMGDLVLTCTGALSRNRAVGVEVGKGRPIAEVLEGKETVAEGVITTRSAYALAERTGIEMPIVAAVHRILFEGMPARDAMVELMTRELRSEAD